MPFSGRPEARPAPGPCQERGYVSPPPPAPGEAPGGRYVRWRRWELRGHAARILRPDDGSRGPGVCACGTARYDKERVDLTLRHGADGERVAGASGVTFCDSPWLCAVCAPRRAGERRERVERVTKATVAKGGMVAMVTITIRHNRHQSLSQVKAALSHASRRARQGKAWTRDAQQASIVGVLVGPEVTVSEGHGWNYHQHMLVPCLSGSRDAVRRACTRMVERYMAALPEGWDAVWEAQDVAVTTDEQRVGDYVSKGTDISWEVASGGATKDRTAAGSMSPFDLLALAAEGTGPRAAWAYRMWHAYAAEMPGTRSCIVTRRMAERLGIEEDDDEDKPGEEGEQAHSDEEVDDTLIAGSLPALTWNTLLFRRRANPLLRLLEEVGFARWDEVERQARAWAAPKPQPSPPPPDPRWRPTDHEVRGARRSHFGSTARQLSTVLDDLQAQARKRGKTLDFDATRVLRILGDGGG